MSWLTRLFHSFTRQKLEEQYTTPKCTNSPKLVAQIYTLLSDIEQRNLKVVGDSVYSTSGHNNRSLVYRAVSFAEYRTEEILGTCSDDILVEQIVDHINANKNRFNDHYYDPDGAGIGTLVDIAHELSKINVK